MEAPAIVQSVAEGRGQRSPGPALPGRGCDVTVPVLGSCTRFRTTPGSSLMLKHSASSFWGTWMMKWGSLSTGNSMESIRLVNGQMVPAGPGFNQAGCPSDPPKDSPVVIGPTGTTGSVGEGCCAGSTNADQQEQRAVRRKAAGFPWSCWLLF